MKKIISILLAMLLIASLAACGENKNAEKPVGSDKVVENEEILIDDTVESEGTPEKEEKEETVKKEPEKEETKKDEEKKPVTAPIAKPEQTPDEKPEQAPAEKPGQTSETKPEAKPEPEPEKAPATLGNTLLADFKAKANAGMSTLAIAEGLMQNEAILFPGGAMEVEPGLLSGFDNTEITGFKSGAAFMPMIGSIAFVGYIFELEDTAAVPGFISKLKSSANMRWNICVEAEEMVTGSVGNKVFFVMCPKSLEE